MAPSANESLSRFTVLVVDDDETLREVIAFDFKRSGFTVLTADSGNQAIEVIKSKKVHLVLSDIRMPGGDGISLLETIRKIDPDIPQLIFVTGYSDVTEEECIQKGAAGVFTKPFDRKKLMEFVRATLKIT